ncbi:MAG: AraC family transcriptional regulator [Burkholderiaceae bacterium]
MTHADTFDAFEASANRAGFTEVLKKDWQPSLALNTHTHPFDVQAQVVAGELWLTAAGKTQHLTAGSDFALAANVPHEERYGAAGATVWIARRQPAAQ